MQIVDIWNADTSQTCNNVQITPGEFNATIVPGDQTAITFLANVTTSNPAPSAFFVNGVQCDQAAAGGSICGTANENSSMTLSCPSGTITSIEFASYGNPDGTCGAFTQGSCHAASSLSVVSSACL